MQNTKNSITAQREESTLKISKTEENIGNTIFHQVEAYLEKYYSIRFNEISLEIECRKLPSGPWGYCNENTLWIEIQKERMKIGQNSLKALLKSDFVPKYNPLKTYFQNLPNWDGNIDYITHYASYLKLHNLEDKVQFYTQFKKWCVRVVKCVMNESYFNKQAFVLSGKKQNIGKSSWCRYLCPPELSNYIAEDFSNNDKDTRILICKNLLINMDELAALSKKEINQLKSLFSKDQVNERLPYDSKNTVLTRTASFIGSTNKSNFLYDETGSVRWLCFVIDGIDWCYSSDFDITNLWSQAYSLSKNEEFLAEMTKEDIEMNEQRNKKFQLQTLEMELLHKYYSPSDKKDGIFMTTTEIVEEIKHKSPMININVIQMGKALNYKNFNKEKFDGSYGYYIQKK